MSVRGLACYIMFPVGLWVAFIAFWLVRTDETLLADIAAVIGGFFLITGPFWIIYVVYLVKVLVPKLDRLAESTHTAADLYSDNWLMRCIRLNNYAANLMSTRVRKKHNLSINITEQPVAIRLSLRIHVYWMCGIILALLIDFLLMEVI